MENQIEIYNELVLLSVAFGQKPEEERLKIYTLDLSDYEFKSVITAIRKIRRHSKFFPSIAEILDLLKNENGTSEEQAIVIANEIFEAIGRFGNYQWKLAQEHLGDEKWDLVIRAGGWNQLCKTEGFEVVGIKAQLRELAKSYISISKRNFNGGEFKLDTSPVKLGNNSLKPLEIA
jgi:hypothetical protein